MMIYFLILYLNHLYLKDINPILEIIISYLFNFMNNYYFIVIIYYFKSYARFYSRYRNIIIRMYYNKIIVKYSFNYFFKFKLY